MGRLNGMECFRVATGLLLSTIPISAWAQTSQPIPVEAAQTYFSEAQSLCQADHGQLWGRSLCGPMMFVAPQSRSIVANQADAKGLLKAENGVFVGVLPHGPEHREYSGRMVRCSVYADVVAPPG